MLDKAIVIAKEAMEFLQSRFPADDKKYGELNRACADMALRLNWLKGEMLAVEHDNKSRYGSPCNCSTCDDMAKINRERMEDCVKAATQEEMAETNTPTDSNAAGVMTLVYDRDAKIDTT
jgi:hypothetical protein